MPRRKAITEQDAQSFIKRDALDRLTGASEAQEPEKQRPGRDDTGQEAPTRVTVYLTLSQIIALEELRMKRLRETGQPVNKSQLIREAVDQLIKR